MERWSVERDLWTSRLDFGGDPDSFVDPESISRQGVNWYVAVRLNKLQTDFDKFVER